MKKVKLKFEHKRNCELGDVIYDVVPDCEHCRAMEIYTPLISNGGTYYCVDCFECSYTVSVVDRRKLETYREQKIHEWYKQFCEEIK